MKRLFAIAVLIGFGITGTPTAAQAAPVSVGVELALLVDVSGSIDGNEFNLQRQGYVDAFRSSAIQGHIANTPGGIAVALIYWSGGSQQNLAVNWTHLTDAASANAFADAIEASNRPFNGLTAPGSAINFTTPLFSSNNFNGDKLVIDVSGDGAQNDGSNTAAARDAAVAAGIQINGLPILGEAGLLDFYTNNIQGGGGSFTLPAAGFDDFGNAINDKIAREITQGVVPEPMSMAVFGFGALVAGGLYRRNRKAQAAA